MNAEEMATLEAADDSNRSQLREHLEVAESLRGPFEAVVRNREHSGRVSFDLVSPSPTTQGLSGVKVRYHATAKTRIKKGFDRFQPGPIALRSAANSSAT